jgi:hypothetical protein
VLQHAGVDHDHNASNHSHDSAATAYNTNDYNNAHERRLLIPKSAHGFVCCKHGPCGRLRVSKGSTEFDRLQPEITRVTRSGFLGGSFRALYFLFFYLTHYGSDRLKGFAIAEIDQLYAHCISPNDSNLFDAGPDELALVGD